MALPAKASVKYIVELGELLETNGSIDEFTYYFIMKNFLKSTDPNDVCAVGFAFALNNEDALAYEHFVKHIRFGNLTIANNFTAFLHNRYHFNQLLDVAFDLSENIGDKSLAILAALEAYRIGRIDMIERHMTKHYSLLREDEGRAEAELYMAELIKDVQNCYDAKICTQRQLELLGRMTHDILEQNKLKPGSVGLFADFGGDYKVQVAKASPEKIVLLNHELAEIVSSEPELDDCEMTARFTVKRESFKEIIYDYNK